MAGEDGDAIRLGVMVNVVSHYDGLLLAPRDFSLQRDGVIFETDVNPKPDVICRPLLTPRSLRKGELARGLVVFTLPTESYARLAHVRYRATRWGGGPALELPLPPFPHTGAP